MDVRRNENSAEKRDQVWQHRRVAEEAALIAEESRDQTLSWILTRASVLNRNRSHSDQLRAYLFYLQALQRNAEITTLTLREEETIKKRAERILRRQNVKPVTSRLSSLYSQIYSSLGDKDARLGDRFGQAWNEGIATYCGGQNEATRFERARRLLRLGDIPGVLLELELVDPKELSQEEAKLFIEALRLSGDSLSAVEHCDLWTGKQLFPPTALAWERASARTQLALSPQPLLNLRAPLVEQQIDLALWCLAVPSRAWLHKRPAIKSDRSELRPVLSFLKTMDFCYDGSEPLTERLSQLGQTLKNATQAPALSQEILIWAAATRWLHRMRQNALARQTFLRYRSLGLTLSSGATADPLGLLSDIQSSFEARLEKSQKVESGFHRSLSVSSLSLELVRALGQSRFRRLFGSEETKKRLKEKEADTLTSIIVRHLSSLKGPLMKLGQTASYFGLDLSAQSGSLLQSLQDFAEPIEFSEVRAVVEKELKRSLPTLFRSFSPTPIGVGSIGQVHQAILHNGSTVAVKVRFPGVRAAIAHDLRLLRLVSPALKLFAPQLSMGTLIEELEKKLSEECDYEREGRLQNVFAEKFRSHGGLHVPKIYADLSSPSVLTSEYCDGVPFRDFIRTASEAERSLAGAHLIEFVVGGCREGLFNTDLHPGNFLWSNGKLVCLDFGSIKEWSAERAGSWIDLIIATGNRDFAAYKQALTQMGMIGDLRNFDFQYVFKVQTEGPLLELSQRSPSRFQHEKVHTEFRKLFTRMNPALPHLSMDPEYLFGFRVYYGCIALLSSLRAECNYGELLQQVCRDSA